MASRDKPKSKQLLIRENQCDVATPMIIKNYLRKSFADILAVELEERIIQALCGPRSEQKVDVAQRLLKLMADVAGEDCTLQTPNTGTQRILVFMADQLSVWMIDAVDAADKAIIDGKVRRLQGIEDGGKGDGDEEDGESDADVQIIHRKKRPSNVRQAAEGGGDGASKAVVKGSKKPPTTGKSVAGGQDVREEKPEPQLGASKKKLSPEGSRAISGQGGSSRDPPPHKENPQKASRDKPKTTSQRQIVEKPSTPSRRQSKTAGETPDGRTSARAKRGNSTSKPEDASKSSVKARQSLTKPTQPRASQSRTEPSQRTTPTASKHEVSKRAPTARTFSRQNSESSPLTASKSSKTDQRPRTASELQREKVKEMISGSLTNMIKEGSVRKTPRAEALRDIISKKLEGSTLALDQQVIDAIKDASVLLASYIDKQAETVELEYGTTSPSAALAQRGKGPVFKVKPTESSYNITKIPHTDAAIKVAKDRGRPAPGTITLSKGGFDPKETKEWANWANNVVNMAEKWREWIDSTVSKTLASAKKNKAGEEVPEWRQWKETAGEEALEWRRNKKLLTQSAGLFQDKMDQSKKPLSSS